MATNHNERIGTRHNRLTVISFHHQDKRWRNHYLCRCECGSEKVIQWSLLISGNTKSCGCWGKEVRKTANKLPNNGGVINQIILGYKRHAKRRGFAWSLTFDEVSNIINKPCYYCGAVNSNKKITKNCQGFPYNGIDRVNSLKDYTIDNVVPCCDFCNKAKGNKTKQEFIAWVKRIYQNAMADQWG